jgi:predicted N-formylglutamate amidohydrolase
LPDRAETPTLLLTCEHGGNTVPARYRRLFADAAFDLQCHRGWDPGALPLAESLAQALSAPLVASTTTRLLVDLNRSLFNPTALSPYTADLPLEDRKTLVLNHYFPHRKKVIRFIADRIDKKRSPVVHVGVHSFTPVLRGRRRDVQVGLLFNPNRPLEAALCRVWREELAALRPRWTIALNRPYKGTDDGLTTSLRRLFEPKQYLGIELEVIQPLLTRTGPTLRRVHQDLCRSLAAALARFADQAANRTRRARDR